MAVYPVCTLCGTRRINCIDVSAHKKHIEWRADVHFSRLGQRLRKQFTTQELAKIQERQWQTDFERGLLLPKKDAVTITFDRVAEEWWAKVMAENRIKNPMRSESSRVTMFKNEFGSRLITSLCLTDGENWLRERIANGKAIGTVNRDMKPLKWIMKYAVQKNYISKNPFDDLKEIPGDNVRVRWMTPAEIDLLVSTATALGDHSLVDVIMVALNTGFRKGNLERLTARDVGEVRITAQKTKSGNPYDVPISAAIKPILSRLIKDNPTGPILNTNDLDARFRKVVKSCNLYTSKGNPDNVTIHTLRHTFAALYLKNGGDLFKLSKLMGHASSVITEKVYGHICPKEIDAQAHLIGTSVKDPILKVI